jgi:hypothetical protein
VLGCAGLCWAVLGCAMSLGLAHLHVHMGNRLCVHVLWLWLYSCASGLYTASAGATIPFNPCCLPPPLTQSIKAKAEEATSAGGSSKAIKSSAEMAVEAEARIATLRLQIEGPMEYPPDMEVGGRAVRVCTDCCHVLGRASELCRGVCHLGCGNNCSALKLGLHYWLRCADAGIGPDIDIHSQCKAAPSVSLGSKFQSNMHAAYPLPS